MSAQPRSRIRAALRQPADVIQSVWIPSLAGKMDMPPGRITRLTVHPTATGTFRGACAEDCGTSHVLMAFHVHVMEQAELAAWMRQGFPVVA